ncbi:MAG TPA: hypothetical protein PK239_14655 [Chitinophagales bacterium]|nr:hypothetical protein [Chitinophagales bacterium]HRK28514.1 hypothetical protein [Chitinophagales bacterium]
MKKYIFSFVAMALLAGFYFSTMSLKLSPPPPVIDHFQNDNLSVITVDKAALSKSPAVAKIAGQLGISSQRLAGSEVNYQNDKDPSEYFITDGTKGRISFSRSTKNYEGDFKPQLLDVKQAQKNAEQFLATNDLNPKNTAEMQLIHAGGIKASSADNGQVIDKIQTFTYGRVIDGVPVSGSGSRIIVHVGNKGEVLGVSKSWKEYTASPTAKRKVLATELRTQADAEKEFGKIVNLNFGQGASPKIKRIQKMYFDGGGNFIQPAYFFETIVSVANEKGIKEDQPFLGVVPMLKNAPEAINPDPATVRTIAKQVRSGQPTQNNNRTAKPDNDESGR